MCELDGGCLTSPPRLALAPNLLSPSAQRHTVDHDDAKSCALSRFAFTLAVENSEDEGYATEKLWQPLLAGSVPIYWYTGWTALLVFFKTGVHLKIM